jgi:hypothetical protein
MFLKNADDSFCHELGLQVVNRWSQAHQDLTMPDLLCSVFAAPSCAAERG